MSIVRRITYVLILCSLGLQLMAQEAKDDISLRGTMVEILGELSERIHTPLIYNPDIFDDQIRDITITNDSIDEAITRLIASQDLVIIRTDESIIIKKKPSINYTGSISQQGSLVSLPYAAIKIKDKDIYTVSDEYGRFHIKTTLPAELQISYLGHRDTTIVLLDNSGMDLKITLRSDNELEEIVIQDTEQNQNLLNRYTYQGDKIKRLTKEIPGIGGNNDLLNATRGIAGISSGNGGIGGYFIRGGNNAQNLFLLDGVSIYNPFHSFGLTSIVTADISQSLQVYKSGFRARHADRSAGIIDIKIKEGNANSYQLSGEINTQDAALSAQGPILNDQTSFFVSGRSTTISGPFNNIVKNAIYGSTDAENGTKYYDIVLKLKSQISPKHSIELTTYKSDDIISGEIEESNEGSDNEQLLHWGNEMYSLNWAAQFKPQVFANTRISTNSYFTDYEFLNEFDDEEDNVLFVNNSSMNRDFNIETRIDALLGQKIRLQSGVNYLSKAFSPNSAILTEDDDEIDPNAELTIDQLSQEIVDSESLKSNLFTAFSEFTFENHDHRLIAGIRLNSYHTEAFNDFSVLPRLSYNYYLSNQRKLEASISRTAQYDHLLSLSDIFLPQDIWYPSGGQLSPQDGWHYNLAYIHSNDHLSIRHELFAKRVSGISYSTFNPLDGGFQELNLYTVQGNSQVYGYELSGEYSNSNLSLMTSLSIAKSTNQFDAINLGNRFPSQFDRLIEFNLLGSYKISKKLTLGFVSYLASGHPLLVTEPVNEELGLVPFDINPIGQKNKERSGLNHRLDLSLIYSFDTGPIKHRLKLNFYNSYNISQPLYFTNRVSGLEPNFSLPSIFSIAYSFNF